MSAVPVSIARKVDARDGYACVRCGASLTVTAGSRHHRQRRRVGGHTTENLVLLCGSGTTGCHGWVHANPAAARAAGYIVPANGRATPADIPVLYWAPGVASNFADHVWYDLDGSGGRERRSEVEALEVLAVFGLLQHELTGGGGTWRA